MEEKIYRQEVTDEQIEKFINGHNPMERIVNLNYSYKNDFIEVYYRDANDVKRVQKDNFYPFVWAKLDVCKKMQDKAEELAASFDSDGNPKLFYYRYEPLKKPHSNECKLDKNGNPIMARKKVYASSMKDLRTKYGISVRKLDTKNNKGNEIKSFSNGYTVLFQANRPMSYSEFLNFFKILGYPVYSEKKDADDSKKEKKSYIAITPQEQYLIYTGKRFFKGYDDYNDILRMIFDLETTGLNTEKDRIEQFGIRFNRPFRYNGRMMSFEKILTVEGETEEEKDASELKCIRTAFGIISEFDPDVITAHNGETFDWNMIIGALKRLGTSIEEESKAFFNGRPIYKSEKETMLKLGGEVEKFFPTIVPGIIVTDSLHAVRRAQATDSNFAEGSLKYAIKYLNLQKNNRVYLPGDKITDVWNDDELRYAFNDKNGDWYLYDPENGKKYSFNGKTKRTYIPHFNSVEDGYELVSGRYIGTRYLLDDLWECDKVEYALNVTDFMLSKIVPVTFQRCCTMGTAGQWKAIMMAWSYENGLAIPCPPDTGKFTGGLSRLLKVGFIRKIIKLDFNSLYPSIILTWGIEDEKDLMGITLKLLNFVLTRRENHKKLKKKAGKVVEKYEKSVANGIALTSDENSEYQKNVTDYKLEDNKQANFKKLGNSFFGAFGSNNGSVYQWKSVDCAERTTCTGRQCLRLMISHFSNIGNDNGLDESYNYEPIVGDTDGFNLQLPENYRFTKDNPYVGKGYNREVEEGKEYTGYAADVAEFNDLYMGKNYFTNSEYLKMGLGIDEVLDSSINISRKNYLDYFPDKPYPEDVKKVGNTVKSKKMPGYIATFLDVAIRLLLQNKGKEFLNEYYDYIDKIYNFRIPLKEIASKGKVKKLIPEYIADCNTITKAGRPKSRQAWMELAIRNNVKVNLGETLYYINTGKSKSHSDCKKVTKYYKVEKDLFGEKKINCTAQVEREWKKYKQENPTTELTITNYLEKYQKDVTREEEIILNCKLLPTEVVESDTDSFCDDDFEYNVAKYIAQFNSRISPLLVCFKPEIRNRIIITNPSDRPYFTDEESELCAGMPNKPGDQDTYEQLMTMEDKEIRFWMAHPEWEIPYLKECGMDWEEIKSNYIARMEREKELGITTVREQYEKSLSKLTDEEFEAFEEEGKLPASISKLVFIDPKTGRFMDKTYNDIEIGSIYDIIDALDNRSLASADNE